MRIDELFDEVALRIPDAPPQVIESAARNALGRFFRNSTAWRVRVAGVAMKAGRAQYDFRDTFEAPVCAITDLRVQGSSIPLQPRTVLQLDSLSPVWRDEDGEMPVRYVAETDPAVATLHPKPLHDGKLDVQAALYPSAKTSEIPDWIGEMFYDSLVDGICGVIHRQPKKSWTDLALSADCEQRLDDAARDARSRVEKSNTLALVFATTSSFDEL